MLTAGRSELIGLQSTGAVNVREIEVSHVDSDDCGRQSDNADSITCTVSERESVFRKDLPEPSDSKFSILHLTLLRFA